MGQFSARCRCCLCELQSLRSLEESSATGCKYENMLEYLTGQEQSMEIANFICDKCEQELTAAYDFKKKCSDSYHVLFEKYKEKNAIEKRVLTTDGKIEIKSDFEDFDLDDIEHDFENIDSIRTFCENEKSFELADQCFNEEDERKESEDIDNSTNIKDNTSVKSKPYRIKCSKCNIFFDTRKDFATHCLDTHKIAKSTKCGLCHISFESQSKYYAHYNKIHRRMCSICDTTFETYKQRSNHYQEFHNKFPIEKVCNFCDLEFESVEEYRQHSRQHKKVVCTTCGKLLSSSNIRPHLDSHNEQKKFNCSECGKLFLLKTSLIKHMRLHTNDMRYECEFCKKKFLHWSTKSRHVISWHTDEKKHKCTLCDQRFGLNYQLVRHMRTHTGETPFECDICLKRFKTRKAVKYHKFVHTDEKKEKCNICGKLFKLRSQLNVHSKIHSGERDYECEVCKKTFTQAHVLRSHMKTHPGCVIPPPGVTLSKKRLEAISERNNSLKESLQKVSKSDDK